MVICIILFSFISSFLFLTRNFVNRYKLYLVFGKKGSGKSTFLCKQAYKYLKKGYVVYTNMEELSLPGLRHINIDDLGNFVPVANSLLIVDEVGMIWDNRNFKSFKPEVRDFFKLQRHYHVVCYLASQTFDIDKKLRDLTDGMYLCVNLFRVFSLAKRITRKVVLTEATSDSESRISENLKYTLPFDWKLTYIPRWSKYYNSFETPNLPHIKFSEPIIWNKEAYSEKTRIISSWRDFICFCVGMPVVIKNLVKRKLGG